MKEAITEVAKEVSKVDWLKLVGAVLAVGVIYGQFQGLRAQVDRMQNTIDTLTIQVVQVQTTLKSRVESDDREHDDMKDRIKTLEFKP